MFSCLATLCVGGCYNYKPVEVTVLDAQTARPVAGASLQTDYNEGLLHVAPRRARAVTGDDGIAHITVADDVNGAAITVHAHAVGYGGAEVDLSLYDPDIDPYGGSPEWKVRHWPYAPVTIRLEPTREHP